MKYIILLAFVFSGALLSAQEMEQVVVPLSSGIENGKLDVDIKSGSVKVTGTNRNDVLVKYRIIEDEDEDHKNEEELKGLKKINNNSFDFNIEEKNSEIVLRSKTWFRGIDLVIEVPSNFDLDINNGMGGDVEVENVNGELNLASYLGSVYARNVSGVANVSSYTGEIVIDFKSIDAGKDMSFTSYTGKIDLTMPPTYASSLKMKTEWGDIYSDLDIVASDNKPQVKKDDSGNGFKLYSDSWTYATLNGGGPEMTIKTQMGSIYLRKK